MRAVRARRSGWRSRRSRCWSCPWSRIDRRVGVPAGGAAARTERQDAAPVFGFEMFVRCFRRRAARRRCWSWSRPPWLSRRLWAIAAWVGLKVAPSPVWIGATRGQSQGFPWRRRACSGLARLLVQRVLVLFRPGCCRLPVCVCSVIRGRPIQWIRLQPRSSGPL